MKKISIIVSFILFTSLFGISCQKHDLEPKLNFYCKDSEKTIQTLTNKKGKIRKIQYSKKKSKQNDSNKSDFLLYDNLYIITVTDGINEVILVPSSNLQKEIQNENIEVIFDGEVTNCILLNHMEPNAFYYDPIKALTIGNKLNISKIEKL